MKIPVVVLLVLTALLVGCISGSLEIGRNPTTVADAHYNAGLLHSDDGRWKEAIGLQG